MGVDRRLAENRSLRERLEALLADGRRNEQIFSRHRRIEIGLMEGSTFPELFDMLFTELRRINDYDAVTLALCDPDHELRRLFEAIGIDTNDYPDLILLGGFSELFRVLEGGGRTSLGAFVKPLHGALFPLGLVPPESVAILPLQRRRRLVGSLNLGSRDFARFSPGMGTDFVERLAGIIAICFENVANHARGAAAGRCPACSSTSTASSRSTTSSAIRLATRCCAALRRASRPSCACPMRSGATGARSSPPC